MMNEAMRIKKYTESSDLKDLKCIIENEQPDSLMQENDI